MQQPASGTCFRAAQYVRMSTEHQRYSIDNQKAVIGEYAARHRYDIVATYADPGKSGLSLRGRNALQRLLTDVLHPARAFDTILVLDVSRWGRFQDPDQAAHYEFICREAGVTVAYCAEMFENDLSPSTTILKHLRRVMAAEYSREHSAKLSRAHLQQARLGFKQGGEVIYGFRRELRDHNGKPKQLLRIGEYKSLKTDHVVVVPGPDEEMAVIRRIFDLYVRKEATLVGIADQLNREGVRHTTCAAWTPYVIRTILANELCIGQYVYNRTSCKLQSPLIQNPESQWVRVQTMRPVIPRKLFAAAQTRLIKRGKKLLNDDVLLDRLRQLLAEHGDLSTALIDKVADAASVTSYQAHFGTMREAYRRIGYTPPPSLRDEEMRGPWTKEELIAGMRRCYEKHGYITNRLIDRDPALPSARSVNVYFGSREMAMASAGLPVLDFAQTRAAALLRRKGPAPKPARLRTRPNGQTYTPRMNPEQMLEGLRRILRQHGHLSSRLISLDPEMCSASTIIYTFGSLIAAYGLAGWKSTRSEVATEMYGRRLAALAQTRREDEASDRGDAATTLPRGGTTS